METWTQADELDMLAQWQAAGKFDTIAGYLRGAKLRSDWTGLNRETCLRAAELAARGKLHLVRGRIANTPQVN